MRFEDFGVKFRQIFFMQTVRPAATAKRHDLQYTKEEKWRLLVKPNSPFAFIDSPNYSSRGPISATMAGHEANAGLAISQWIGRRHAG